MEKTVSYGPGAVQKRLASNAELFLLRALATSVTKTHTHACLAQCTTAFDRLVALCGSHYGPAQRHSECQPAAQGAMDYGSLHPLETTA